MPYFELIMNIIKGVWSLKNIRFALIFKGQDFAQTEGDEPLTEDNVWFALTEAERKHINNNPHLQKHWDESSLAEKVFYVELKRNKATNAAGIPTTPVTTQSEEFLEFIRTLKYESEYFGTLNIGRYIGWITPIMNFAFSPTFGRIVALVAAGAIMATPLGYTVGAIGMSIALLSLAYDTYRYVDKYRELNRVKEEKVLLDEIKKVSEEIEQSRGLGETAFDKINVMATASGLVINPNKTKPSLIDAATYVAQNNFANMITATVLSVATLSPIAIMASMFMMITGYSAATAIYGQFNNRFVYLCNANAIAKAELGLEGDLAPGNDIEYLRKRLSHLRCYNLAVKEVMQDPEAKKETFNTEYLRTRLAEAFEYHVLVSEKANSEAAVERPSFLADTWTLLKDGISWEDINRRFTPSFMEADVMSHYSNETFENKRRKAIEGMEKELHIGKAEGVEAKHKNPAKETEVATNKRKRTSIAEDVSEERVAKKRKSFAERVPRNEVNNPEEIKKKTSKTARST